MFRPRLFLLLIGIPGLLVYATLAVAQWRGGLALSEFKSLQEAYPPDSLHPIAPSVAARKMAVLLEASRMAPTDPEPAYQTSLLNLIRAEGQSLAPKGPSGEIGSGPDRQLARLLQEGLLSIRRAILLNPGVAEYHFVEALILQNLGAAVEVSAGSDNPERAVAALLGISHYLDPYKPSLHYRIGGFHLALGNQEGARRAFTIALSDSYRYARPVFDLLWSWVEDTQKLRNLVGNDPLSRALLADFLWNHGYKMEAEFEYKFALSRQPIDYRTGELLIQQFLRKSDYVAARRVLSALEQRKDAWTDFQLGRFQYYRGRSFLLEGRYDEAIKAYQQALKWDDLMVQCHVELGKAYLENEQPQEAIARWRYILANHLNDHTVQLQLKEIHFGLGRAYELVGNWPLALSEYLQASSLDPTNAILKGKISEISRRL